MVGTSYHQSPDDIIRSLELYPETLASCDFHFDPMDTGIAQAQNIGNLAATNRVTIPEPRGVNTSTGFTWTQEFTNALAPNTGSFYDNHMEGYYEPYIHESNIVLEDHHVLPQRTNQWSDSVYHQSPVGTQSPYCSRQKKEEFGGVKVEQISPSQSPQPPCLHFEHGRRLSKAGRKRRECTQDLQLSKPELEKKERRRAQNRNAAEKCRKKKKVQHERMLKDYHRTQELHTKLENEVQELQEQNRRLEQLLKRHLAVCQHNHPHMT